MHAVRNPLMCTVRLAGDVRWSSTLFGEFRRAIRPPNHGIKLNNYTWLDVVFGEKVSIPECTEMYENHQRLAVIFKLVQDQFEAEHHEMKAMGLDIRVPDSARSVYPEFTELCKKDARDLTDSELQLVEQMYRVARASSNNLFSIPLLLIKETECRAELEQRGLEPLTLSES